jgi:hypothetical protein
MGVAVVDHTLESGRYIVHGVTNPGDVLDAMAQLGIQGSAEQVGRATASAEGTVSSLYGMAGPVRSLGRRIVSGTDEAAEAAGRTSAAAAGETMESEATAPSWRRYEERYGGRQTPMETTFEGRTVRVRLDKPPSNAQIIDFKDYNWSNPRYLEPFIRDRVIEDFTQQIRKYRTIRPNVHLQFSKDPPDWVVEAIKRAGGTYSVSP